MKHILQLALIVFLVSTCSTSTFSQDTLLIPSTDTIILNPLEPSPWRLKAGFGLNGTQSSFVNWNAGGRNNISAIAFFSGSADYSKNKWLWKNNLELALGGLKYLDSTGRKEGFQKTDDKIDFATNIGFKLKEKWYLSMIGGFRTQFMDGYTYPNDSIQVSRFMAPGYINLSLGIDYTPNENFSLFLSPLSAKVTIVNDQRLADAGAFGVDKGIFGPTGEVTTSGNKIRYEYGAYLKMTYNKELFKNVNFKSRLELFSNYAENPQNIDVNADVLWTFKVNSWLSASLNWTLIYDDDIDIRDVNGNVGPRTQFKSVLGLGISYTLKNFKE